MLKKTHSPRSIMKEQHQEGYVPLSVYLIPVLGKKAATDKMNEQFWGEIWYIMQATLQIIRKIIRKLG